MHLSTSLLFAGIIANLAVRVVSVPVGPPAVPIPSPVIQSNLASGSTGSTGHTGAAAPPSLPEPAQYSVTLTDSNGNAIVASQPIDNAQKQRRRRVLKQFFGLLPAASSVPIKKMILDCVEYKSAYRVDDMTYFKLSIGIEFPDGIGWLFSSSDGKMYGAVFTKVVQNERVGFIEWRVIDGELARASVDENGNLLQKDEPVPASDKETVWETYNARFMKDHKLAKEYSPAQ